MRLTEEEELLVEFGGGHARTLEDVKRVLTRARKKGASVNFDTLLEDLYEEYDRHQNVIPSKQAEALFSAAICSIPLRPTDKIMTLETLPVNQCDLTVEDDSEKVTSVSRQLD